MKAIARWLPLSLALHVAGALLIGVLLREVVDGLPPLFVDLTVTPEPVATERASSASATAVPAVAPSPAPRRTPARPPAPPTPMKPSAPAPLPAAPVPAPVTPPAVVTPPAPAMPPDIASAPVLAPPRESGAPALAPPSAGAPPLAGPQTPAGQPSTGSSAMGGSSEIGAAAGTGTARQESSTARDGRDGGADGSLTLAVPGDGSGSAYREYLAVLVRRIHESLHYPPVARRRGLTGTVHLEIALEPSGAVSNVVLVRTSAHRVLDEAAVEAVRALPRVPFPPDVRPRALLVRLPVVFELR